MGSSWKACTDPRVVIEPCHCPADSGRNRLAFRRRPAGGDAVAVWLASIARWRPKGRPHRTGGLGAASGWDDPDPAAPPEDTILARLLALNLERAGVAG